MKKFTAMLLTLCFTLMIVGCGDDAKPKGGKTETKASTTTTVEKK
jgi:hypothetical protein